MSLAITSTTSTLPYKNVLVTGGCGFIGSNFLQLMVPKYPNTQFVNLDKLDYCATLKNVQEIANLKNYQFIRGDILDEYLMLKILNLYQIEAVVHFAAQSHVDNSFGNSIDFTLNNVLGTHKLLEACRIYSRIQRFVHISTDEVYGEVEVGESHEKSTLDPTNPYAATKAATEFIVKSYYRSFQLPILITRGNNVYGPRQYPEKLIPRFISSLAQQEKCPIQGDGRHIRSFIHAEDTCRAVETVLIKGEVGETYNIGSPDAFTVWEIACLLVEHMKPDGAGESYKNGEDSKQNKPENWVTYVTDRKFNDVRYAISCEKLKALGWQQEVDFRSGLKATIQWYLERPDYYKKI